MWCTLLKILPSSAGSSHWSPHVDLLSLGSDANTDKSVGGVKGVSHFIPGNVRRTWDIPWRYQERDMPCILPAGSLFPSVFLCKISPQIPPSPRTSELTGHKILCHPNSSHLRLVQLEYLIPPPTHTHRLVFWILVALFAKVWGALVEGSRSLGLLGLSCLLSFPCSHCLLSTRGNSEMDSESMDLCNHRLNLQKL